MEPAIFIVGVIILAIIIRLVAGSFDGERVERHLREMGYELIDKSWDPFGPGWFGEKDSRIYQVVYRDTSGNVHQAHVKTSMMSGVYLTNDRIIERHSKNSIQDEKTMLMRRLAEIEHQEKVEQADAGNRSKPGA